LGDNSRQYVRNSIDQGCFPLLATVGNTPLLRLEKIAREFPGIEIFGKAEYFNPGGSVKDRAALNMVLDGERSGKLNHHRV
jgi:cysteine synthase B